MPLNIDFLQVLLHMLNFVILAGGLSLLLYKPICRFLDQRTAHFDALARDNAEKAAENDRLKAEYQQKLTDAETEIAARKTQAEKDAVMAQLDEIIRRFQILGRKMIVVVPSIDLTVHATLDDIKADAVAVLREMAKKVEPYGIKLSNEENIKKAAEVIRAHVEACC